MVCNQQKGSNSTSHLFDPSVNSQLPSTGEGGGSGRDKRGEGYIMLPMGNNFLPFMKSTASKPSYIYKTLQLLVLYTQQS